MARTVSIYVNRAAMAALIVIATFSATRAFAALGEPETSLRSDQERLSASDRVTSLNHYSIHHMVTPAGTTIRQFVSTSGTVFAVSWEGTSPNLRQLLGSHYDEYIAAVQSMPSRRGRGVRIDTGELVVETGGHMGYVTGRALLRSQVPQEVDSDEIR